MDLPTDALKSPAHVYTDEARMRMVMDCLRGMSDRGETCALPAIQSALQRDMASKTAWKALQSLVAEGIVSRGSDRCPTGQLRVIYELEWWYEMNDEQRERAVCALERIADALEGMAPRKARRETKAMNADERKGEE